MPYSSVPVESFGGLDLDSDPGDVGWRGAIDILDVELDRRGILRSRDKFTTLVANTSLTSPNLVPWPAVGFMASTSTAIKLYDTGGNLSGTAVAPNIYYYGGQQEFGTPTTSYMYLADTTATNAIRRLTTAGVISAPAGMPTARFLSRSPTDNRLVAANTSTNFNRVQFSNAGDAETWGANDYVDLDPGDGDQIMGMVTWRDLLFVFKSTKFYVFYGTSVDSTGNPVFNYRAYRGGVGSNNLQFVSTESGVYFTSMTFGPQGRSVWKTTGGEPVCISNPIRRALNSIAPSTFTPGTSATGAGQMAYANGRLFLGLVSQYVWVYNISSDQWTLHSFGSTAAQMCPIQNSARLIVATTGANAAVHKLDPTNTSTDSLRSPTPLYRSGFSDLGTADEKVVREWRVEGSGSPTFKTSTDFGSLETGATMTLGTSPAVSETRRRYATRGRQFSWQVSASDAISINSVVAHVRDKRAAGTDS